MSSVILQTSFSPVRRKLDFCIFCCKKSRIPDKPNCDEDEALKVETDQNKVRKLFFKLVSRQCGISENSADHNLNDIKTCSDCFGAIDSYCRQYHILKCLELELSLKLDKLMDVMKLANCVPARTKGFRTWCEDEHEKRKTLPQFRRKFMKNCKLFQKKTFPKVSLGAKHTDKNINSLENNLNSESVLDSASTSHNNSHDKSSDNYSRTTTIQYFLGWATSLVAVVLLCQSNFPSKRHVAVSKTCDDANIPSRNAKENDNEASENHLIQLSSNIFLDDEPLMEVTEDPLRQDDMLSLAKNTNNPCLLPVILPNTYVELTSTSTISVAPEQHQISNVKSIKKQEFWKTMAKSKTSSSTLELPKSTDDQFINDIKPEPELLQQIPTTSYSHNIVVNPAFNASLNVGSCKFDESHCSKYTGKTLSSTTMFRQKPKQIVPNNSLVFKCTICGTSFKSRKAYNNHKRTHIKSVCPYCGIHVVRNLNRHIRTHTGEKPYKCEEFERTFTDRGNYLKHKMVHQIGGAKVFSCDLCDRAFSQKTSILRHKRLCHSDVMHN